jgi:trimethylamine:corrinoid methyltransferase-like protein
LEVTPDTIAANLIQQIGPQGDSYLMQEHTLERLRSKEYFVPDLAVRGSFASWMAAGGHDTYALARARAARLAANPVKGLDEKRRMALEATIHQTETGMSGE